MSQLTFAREVVSGGFDALPGVNTRITVSVPSLMSAQDAFRDPETPTRVEDVELQVSGWRRQRASLVVAEPMFRGMTERPEAGAVVTLRWLTPRGCHEVATTYVGAERIGPAVIGWRLSVTGKVTRIQRRAHARVDLVTPVDVLVLDEIGLAGRPAGVSRAMGRTVNVSEGGVLAVVEAPAPMVRTAVVVRMTLQGESFVLPGRVVRHQQLPLAGWDSLAVGIAFDNPDEHGDRLRRLLFGHQLRERRAGGHDRQHAGPVAVRRPRR